MHLQVHIEIDPQALSLAISQQAQLVQSPTVAALPRMTPSLVTEAASNQSGMVPSVPSMVDIGMKRSFDMVPL